MRHDGDLVTGSSHRDIDQSIVSSSSLYRTKMFGDR